LHTRLQSRGGVLVLVGDPGSVSADVRLNASTRMWEGLGDGHGHLQRRQVSIELDARRRGRPTRADVWLPDHRGGLSACDISPSDNVLPLRRTG